MKNPVTFVVAAAGLVRGFAAAMLRVAAGEQGPVIPGYLPGPVAAPVEENVSHDDITRLVGVDPPTDDSTGDLPGGRSPRS